MSKILEFLTNPFIFDTFDKSVSVTASLYGCTTYLSYIIACYMLFGITKSISITWYSWPAAKHNFLWAHNLCWVFQMFMFVSAASIFFIAQNGLYFIVGVLFAVMAMFPSVEYKGKIGPFLIYHSICACSAIALMLVGLPLCYGIKGLPFTAAAAIGDILILIFCKQRPTDYDGDGSTTKLYWIENMSISAFMAGIITMNCLTV